MYCICTPPANAVCRSSTSWNAKGFAPGPNLVVTPYINNMPQLLAAADLVIARSGALTLAELEVVGRASILIPSPNVAGKPSVLQCPGTGKGRCRGGH